MPLQSQANFGTEPSIDAYQCPKGKNSAPAKSIPVEVNDLNQDSELVAERYDASHWAIDFEPKRKPQLPWTSLFQSLYIKPLLWVIFGHCVLLLLLLLLWRSQLTHIGLFVAKQAINAPQKALKAYFIYAPKTDIQRGERLSAESAENLASNESARDVSERMKLSDSKKVMSTIIETTPLIKNPAQSSLNVNVPANKPLVTQQIKPFASGHAQASLDQNNPQAMKQEMRIPSGNSSLFTQGYIARQRDLALDELVNDEAKKYTQKSALSEMSPEMEILIVPNADDFSGETSLDLPLDPNRIIRKGDTCYRVVKLGTQINPYAENLGFPFDCSGKKINQAIEDAINLRLDKLIKRH
ncbi:hypothetical protein L9G16_13530 [Shewanella sp. A25]|nr:hypothetical protein [Shewanella shenzhenensis]